MACKVWKWLFTWHILRTAEIQGTHGQGSEEKFNLNQMKKLIFERFQGIIFHNFGVIRPNCGFLIIKYFEVSIAKQIKLVNNLKSSYVHYTL